MLLIFKIAHLASANYNGIMPRKKQNTSLENRVLSYIREHQLLKEKKLVVGVSGGPDSVCLLHILVQIKDELGIELHVAHLNHQLRNAESDSDARYVEELSKHLGVPATIETRNVKAYQVDKRLSLEEAAREVRYTFLAQVAGQIGTNYVAVGHTTDDHIETILMHLIRGTGTRGLRGLQPITRWQLGNNRITVIRPLLEVRRDETAAYCQLHKLEPRLDVSNLSLSMFRNRLRLELLPFLRRYNPQIDDALLRTARIAADDLAFLESEATKLFKDVAQKKDSVIILNKEKILGLAPALKRQILRLSIENLRGDIRDIEALHIEEIMDALSKQAGKRLNLPGGLIFAVEYDRYLLGSDLSALAPFPQLEGDFMLNVPGETRIPGWLVKSKYKPADIEKETPDNFRACFDMDKIGTELVIRTRRRGDRFQPLGMEQPKKLGEFMIDARIPVAWRDRIPLVCSTRQIIWVAGYRIDDRVKVTPYTSRILCLEMKRDSDEQPGKGGGNSREAEAGTL